MIPRLFYAAGGERTFAYQLISHIKDSILLLLRAHFSLPRVTDWNSLSSEVIRIKPMLMIILIRSAKPPYKV